MHGPWDWLNAVLYTILIQEPSRNMKLLLNKKRYVYIYIILHLSSRSEICLTNRMYDLWNVLKTQRKINTHLLKTSDLLAGSINHS